MRIAVIDGQGGRLGQGLVERMLSELPDADLIAVGLNSQATKSMLKGGAKQIATGENAVLVACRRVFHRVYVGARHHYRRHHI